MLWIAFILTALLMLAESMHHSILTATENPQ